MSPFTRTLVFAVAAATGLWAQNIYRVTTIGGGGGSESYAANGINNGGQVVGTFTEYLGSGCEGVGCPYPFLYSGGSLSLLFNPPGLGDGIAINNTGEIVGPFCYESLLGACVHYQANLYSGGVWTPLGFLPGAMESSAAGINDSGQIVGSATNNSGNEEAFLYSAGVMTGLGTLPGDTDSSANAINQSGQIVGLSLNASRQQAFLYSGGVMTGLGTLPGDGNSWANAINQSGQVVGFATDSSGNWQAFLYADGAMTGLGALPGYAGSVASAINNKGQIVGWLLPPPGADVDRGGAFLYSDGQMVDLNTILANSSGGLLEATGINDSGQIIAGDGWSAYLLSPAQGRFVAVAPCRVVDTRVSPGPFGGPAINHGSPRSFAIPQGACGIPATAQAFSLNVTVVPQGPLAYLTVWPTGLAQPFVSTLNSYEGEVVANAALVGAGQNGALSVYATGPTDVILDINGYFDSASGDSFYPLQPCRVEDTRGAVGPLGGPAFTAGETRNIPVPASPCGLPATATAYSMNATVVPDGYLGFLTTWAAGQPQPFVSTLNSWTGKVVANAAIVPAGTNGATSVYVTNPTDVILDANGYFAAPGNAGALTFYPVVPCRVADTREADEGPILAAGETRSFAIPTSGCSIPSSAAAYALNITVVPDGPLSYLTAWPTGSPRPIVSTLNSLDGSVVANAAIVPTGAAGAISVYVTDPTQVVLDINGYFAQ